MSDNQKTTTDWIVHTPKTGDDAAPAPTAEPAAEPAATTAETPAAAAVDTSATANTTASAGMNDESAKDTPAPNKVEDDSTVDTYSTPPPVQAGTAAQDVDPGNDESAESVPDSNDSGSSDDPDSKDSSDSDDPDSESEEGPSEPLSLMDHFRELRNRLIKSFIVVVAGFCICWAFRAYLVDFLYAPLLSALQETGQSPQTIATGVAENFFTIMKIAFVGGIFLGSPLIFYQIWAFIAPGLYDDEKVYIVPVALASAVFFLLGGSFCYLVVFPNALPFLLGFGESYMVNTPKASEYYGFALQLLFAFGLIFEMPLFVFFLARLGIVTSKMLSKFRRYFIVIAFIAAAVLTPPDVMSQLLMAAPMLLLYEFSILIARIFGKERKKKKAQNAENEDAPENPEQSAQA